MKKSLMSAAAFIALFAGSFLVASAASPLSVSCAGTPGSSSIMWSATTTGGILPISVVWSNGSTSTAQTVSVTPGTYMLSVTAADASSTMATSSCSATLLAPAPSITSFTANPSSILTGQSSLLSWTVANATTLGIDNGVGTVLGTSTTVSPTHTTIYMLTAANAGGTTTALVTVSVSTPLPTSTPPIIIPLKRHPSLIINEQGNFVGRGLLVESVASGSFSASVWGVTYTVFSPTNVIVGDYADVVGKVSTSSPLTVMARVVRDHSSHRIVVIPTSIHGDHGHGWHTHDSATDEGTTTEENDQNQNQNSNSHGHGKGHVHVHWKNQHDN